MHRQPVYLCLTLLFLLYGLIKPNHVHAEAVPNIITAPTQETEPNDDFASANSMSIGAANPMTAGVSSKTDVDFFKFTATAGLPYTVEIFDVAKAVNDQGGGMQLFVYDSNFSVIDKDVDYDSNGVGNVVASVTFNANATGVYFLKVSPYYGGNGNGPYKVRVLPRYDQPEASWNSVQEPNNSSTHAFKLTVGTANAITSTIEGLNSAYLADYNVQYDVDWFYFNAEAGQVYVIETYNVAKAVNRDGGAMQLFLYDNNFSQIAKDDGYDSNGTGNRNASLVFTANTTGVYFIQVSPWYNNWGSGPYSIRILPKYDQPEAVWDTNQEPNNWAEHAYKIEVGRTNAIHTNIERRESAYLTDSDDVDVFWFETTAGQPYVVETFDVAKAINPPGYAMQMFVYDSNNSLVGKDDGGDSSGAGNNNATVEFVATLGGRYHVVIYPYYYSAGFGPYSLRVLPRFDQPNASWDAAMEPNNTATHPSPLNLDPCGRLTSIEPRSNSFLTDAADRDWFVFTVQQGKQYTFALEDGVSKINDQFGSFGLEVILYNKEFSKVKDALYGNPPKVTFTADYSGIYYALAYPYSDANGTYRVKISEALGANCNGTTPLAAVEGNVSTGTNPDTGEVTIRGPRNGGQVTISTLAKCPNSAPQNVNLLIGNNSYPMTHAEGDRYIVTLTLPADSGNMPMRATYSCSGTTVTNIIGHVVLIDPSGQIIDKATGAPVVGAQVTLYHVANAQPDANGQAGNCRTTETRGGNDWSQLPRASLNSSERIDGLAETISTSPQINPAINPQITGADGRYAWNVIPGCWYISVEAAGYQTVTSPVVGIPPTVTDLNIQLEKQVGGKFYLPMIRR